MVKCNQLCEWNRYKHGCTKPLPVACPLETALGNAGVANENPVTNADRIRAMSDEELAKWMAGLTTVGACNDLGIPDSDLCDRKCESCCLAWLRRAAEEEL